MARVNTYTCATCGTTYEFCIKCQVTLPDYDAGKFCCKTHAEIFVILSKHGCNLATAEETLAALSAYNLDEITLTEDILAHIEKIKSEADVKVEEVTPIVEEKVIVEESTLIAEEQPIVKTNKNNNKKKW